MAGSIVRLDSRGRPRTCRYLGRLPRIIVPTHHHRSLSRTHTQQVVGSGWARLNNKYGGEFYYE